MQPAPQVGSPPPPQSVGTPPPAQTPDIFAQAKQQWPVLNNPNIHYEYTPKTGDNVPFLEAFPPGEPGAPNERRPSQFPMNAYGIQVFKPTTRPIDVLGDVVSHFLRNTDPVIGKYYNDFKASMTPQQVARLHDQYQTYVQQGEKRPFDQWAEQSGIPAWFRGYAFQQWPNAQSLYTPDQIKAFDSMMHYLSTSRAPGTF